MEELFPSEIARLVLGYLKENKCEKSWKLFLDESSSLQEYSQLYKRGKLYPTNVNGKSLLDILNEYCSLKRHAENNCSDEFSENTFKEKCKIVMEEIVTDAVEHVLLKYFPSISGNSHQDNSQLDATKSIHISELTTNNCIEYENTSEKNETVCSYNDNIAEISSQNFDSNVELNVRDCNIDQSGSGVNVAINALIEPSVSDSIYLQEIIKVEKDNDSYSVLENSPEKNISDIRNQDMKQDRLSSGFSECDNDLNSFKNKSKVGVGNSFDADSTSAHNTNADKTIASEQATDAMDVEIIKTVKLEPNSEINCTENKTISTNCFQNSSIITPYVDRSTVENSQTALCDSQNSVSQFNNLVNNTNFSTNQSGYAMSTTPFSGQPVTINDLSFSSVPTYIMPNYSSNGPYMQNNAQYSFVINTPTPWKEATVGGFSLNLPSIPSNSLGPVLTSIDSVGSSSTPSVPTVCVNNALSPALTAVDPAVSKNILSAPGISINTIPSPALTAIDSAATGQSLTVSSVPPNVSSYVNPAGSINTVPNSKLVTSDTAASKSNKRSMNKNSPNKKPCKRKNKSELLKDKELQSKAMSSGKDVYNKQSRRKLLPLYPSPSCLLETGKKTDKNHIPNNANPQLQSRPVLAKKTTRRKGK